MIWPLAWLLIVSHLVVIAAAVWMLAYPLRSRVKLAFASVTAYDSVLTLSALAKRSSR